MWPISGFNQGRAYPIRGTKLTAWELVVNMASLCEAVSLLSSQLWRSLMLRLEYYPAAYIISLEAVWNSRIAFYRNQHAGCSFPVVSIWWDAGVIVRDRLCTGMLSASCAF